jgi:hypothetical protein
MPVDPSRSVPLGEAGAIVLNPHRASVTVPTGRNGDACGGMLEGVVDEVVKEAPK